MHNLNILSLICPKPKIHETNINLFYINMFGFTLSIVFYLGFLHGRNIRKKSLNISPINLQNIDIDSQNINLINNDDNDINLINNHDINNDDIKLIDIDMINYHSDDSDNSDQDEEL